MVAMWKCENIAKSNAANAQLVLGIGIGNISTLAAFIGRAYGDDFECGGDREETLSALGRPLPHHFAYSNSFGSITASQTETNSLWS